MPLPRQKIVENWKGVPLGMFALGALEILKEVPELDEVVLPANNIAELEHDHRTPPRQIHPLPEGFEYNFSGFAGHVLGVRRVGIWDNY